MDKTIRVYHDYICPFCYIAYHTVHRLEREFGVRFDWIGWQINPSVKRQGEPREKRELPFIIKRLAYDQNITFSAPPFRANTYLALQGAEFAKAEGKFTAYNDEVYEAYWKRGLNISQPDVLASIAEGVGLDAKRFRGALESGEYERRVLSDDDADRLDIQLVPTFVFGGHRVVGNIPYAAIREAVKVHALGYDSII